MADLTSISERKSRQTTILCVDEDKHALDRRVSELEAAGFRVLAANDGRAAVKLFVEEEIDLILSSLLLPGVSGAQLSVFLRQVRPEVSLVLMCRYSRLPASLFKHVDGHIANDSPARDVVGCVQNVLSRRTINKAPQSLEDP